MHSWKHIGALALALSLAAAPTAVWADAPQKPLIGPAHNFSWDDAVGTSITAFERAMYEGDVNATKATHAIRRGLTGRVKRAIRAYQEAIAIKPDSSEAHYRLAQVIYTFHVSGEDRRIPDAKKTELVLHHWNRFEELAPLDPRLPDVLFQKSLTLTKQANEDGFRRAIAIYDRLLAMSSADSLPDGNTIAIYLGNKAELHMMVGELDEAIELYSQANEYGGRSWLGYGLAVALDRDGQEVKARQVMRTNLFSDKHMQKLSQDGTFFVPAGEKYYYLALGYEVLGEHKKAAEHYRAFIRSGAHPRFQPRAKAHLDRLESKRRRGGKGRVPKRGSLGRGYY